MWTVMYQSRWKLDRVSVPHTWMWNVTEHPTKQDAINAYNELVSPPSDAVMDVQNLMIAEVLTKHEQ